MGRKRITNHISRIRHKHGWSVAALGQLLGLSPRTVEGYEQGRPVPPPVLKLLEKVISRPSAKK